jgi:DNA-binding response OmpR family regulator
MARQIERVIGESSGQIPVCRNRKNILLGLESGANDYVTKPFRFAVLLARIRAQLRQPQTSFNSVSRDTGRWPAR